MTHREAVSLIYTPWFRSNPTPTRWADLGCGSGTFTLALAELLAPGSIIEAIDLHPSVPAQTTARGVTIHPRAADFTSLQFTRPDPASPNLADPNPASPNPADPNPAGPNHASPNPAGPNPAGLAPMADRLWPGLEPLAYHGILMANSLHYVRDQHTFLTRLKTNALLLIEYDIDIPVARWVPYPLSLATAKRLLESSGWPHVQKLGALPSAFGRADLYAALALPEPATLSP